MVDNDAFTGSYTKNPFTFNHYNLEFLAVYIDGQQFPAKPLQPNFESGSAVSEFYQLATATRRHLKNQALSINRDNFLNSYTLYAFNLTSHLTKTVVSTCRSSGPGTSDSKHASKNLCRIR
ncbi:hypothetical protein QQF64_033772 [Cirrhinus molitorella]|uniref:Uncharacterized protein n=1 Tax=Cirrhinus molitorella TaxID=172907 RepID=A0ABR3MUW8_9TELE